MSAAWKIIRCESEEGEFLGYDIMTDEDYIMESLHSGYDFWEVVSRAQKMYQDAWDSDENVFFQLSGENEVSIWTP